MVYIYKLYTLFFPSSPLAENTESHKFNTGNSIPYYKTNSKTLTQLTSYQQAQLTEMQTACKISAESVISCLIYPSQTACAVMPNPNLAGSLCREQNLPHSRKTSGIGNLAAPGSANITRYRTLSHRGSLGTTKPN